MKVLDRYLVRQFLVNFLILLTVLLALFMLFDLVNDMDEFVQGAQAREARFGSFAAALLYVLFDYYLPVSILLYAYLAGLVVVGAMGFTLAQMARHRELVALAAGGVSMQRVAMPILVAGGLLNMSALLAHEVLVPRFASELTRSKSDLEYLDPGRFPVHYLADSQSNLFIAESFRFVHGEMEAVTILERNAVGHVKRRISASQARWDPAREGWELVNAFAVARHEGGEVRDGPEAVAFFATDLAPAVIEAHRTSRFSRLLSTEGLHRLAENPALGAAQAQQVEKVIWSRFSMIVCYILILMMGMPFFLHLGALDLSRQAVKLSGIACGGFGAAMLLMEIGNPWLGPVAAAWLPVAVFLPLAVFAMQGMEG